MRRILAVLFATALTTGALAQQPNSDVGKADYEASCAVCHGMDGKGDGMVVAALKVKPSDLTMLSRKNGGVFPLDRLISVIDGRAQILSHGTRDMPIWGTRYSVLAAEHYFDIPYDQEKFVRAQILSLTDYIYRIQQK